MDRAEAGTRALIQIWDHMKHADEELLGKITAHLKQHMDKEAQAKAA